MCHSSLKMKLGTTQFFPKTDINKLSLKAITHQTLTIHIKILSSFLLTQKSAVLKII